MLLENSTLIVYPTSRAIRNEIKGSKENSLLPLYLTIDEFFKKSIQIPNKKYCEQEQRLIYLKEASSKDLLNKLGISQEFSSFLKQSDYIFRFFGELASEKVNIDDLDLADTYEYYNEHIQILKNIYKSYISKLDKNNTVDKVNLPNNYTLNESFLKRFTNIEINFEGYFTNFEFELIQMISKYSNTTLKFTYNKYNRKSIQKFINIGFSLKEDYDYEVCLSTNKILYEKRSISYIKNFDIKAFSSRVNQIAYIKTSISNAVNEGVEPSKIALITPDEKFVSYLQMFDYENYFNFAMGKDIKNSKSFKIVNAIYNFLNEDEKLTLKTIEFLDISKEYIESNFKINWNKNISKDIFNTFLDYIKEKEDNNELLKKLDELFYSIKHLFFNSLEDNSISLKEAIKILLQKMQTISLDDINSGLVTVLGLLESRAVSFDAVIICDFNEEYIPKKSIKDKFLSTNIKKSVGLPTLKDRENLQKYYYNRLINGARNVYISYVLNETTQLSRFAQELFDIKKLELSLNVVDNQYKHILYQNKNIKHFDEDIVIKNIDLSKKQWSSTSLKIYLECKRKYYLKYIEKIKSHYDGLKPQGFEFGDLVHKTLYSMYKNGFDKVLDYDLLYKEFKQKFHDNPFLLLDKEVFLTKLKSFVSLEKSRFDKGVKVVDCEKDFSINHNGIQINGSIDRIDKSDDMYVLLDYKTSSSLKIDTIKNYDKSCDFQLEFYFLACKYLFDASNVEAYYYDLHEMSLKKEIVLFEKLELLEKIFDEFKVIQDISFSKCESKSYCQYCEYKTICDR